MKTTIDLPDALAADAREFARSRGLTLREVVIDGLRHELARRESPAGDFEFRLRSVPGRGLRQGVRATELIDHAYQLPA